MAVSLRTSSEMASTLPTKTGSGAVLMESEACPPSSVALQVGVCGGATGLPFQDFRHSRVK
ncbi:hypothetical protein SCLCIDRAFT_1212177 [Scleroderma citrinum Foug A]|uniref:Uncharacterized protein n=1 Tax=Scleroderma citrinum Foug A TaxID=1036808 RepID=A0A0C3EAU0_9AGAM|nr:hypothetical protein SCLCIDRAFT_1212177 [Scleroderma citrinum Foug A]